MITNDSAFNNGVSTEKKRTFLYEYMSGKSFKLEELDDIMMARLSKNKDENKFIYLF